MARSLQHQIVARALDIISDEERWTCLAVARTANGSHCDCRDVAATRFCAVGALYRASDELLGEMGSIVRAENELFSSEHELKGFLAKQLI